MDFDALLEDLASKDCAELDALLDARDAQSFDAAWVGADRDVPAGDEPENLDDQFIALSKATEQHEICSYVADDIRLLWRAAQSGVTSPFLLFLRASYKNGAFPSTWEG